MNNFKKFINKLKENHKNIKLISMIILIIIIICILIWLIVQESKKQKYVEYDGENLNESKYPG